MKTILVTGGLGYIGSHIVVELLNHDKDYKVIIIDNLSTSKIDKIDSISRSVEKSSDRVLFFLVDVRQYSDIENIFREHHVDIVIHAAGLKSIAESIKYPSLYYDVNVVGTFSLIRAMKKYGCKKLIFSSSGSVYGSSTSPYREDSITGVGIKHPYGKTKYIQEEFLKDIYSVDKTWDIAILRYFNPVGQKNMFLRENPNKTPNNLFPYIVGVYKGELSHLTVYGRDYEDSPDGTCIRDFIHVCDLADAHVKVCDRINEKRIGFKIYNVGSEKGVSVQQMIDSFERANNTSIRCEYSDRREGDVSCMVSDCSLIYDELGWKTVRTLDDIVRLT